MKNSILRKQRIFFIRPSRHHLFGTDFQRRDEMTDEEAVSRFDEVWTNKIAQALDTAEAIEYSEAIALIPKAGQAYCTEKGNQHFRFKLSNTVYIAQVAEGTREHNQLWALSAQNFDTRTVFTTFDEQAERDEWTRLASRFHTPPEDLARRVLTAYLRSFADV